MGDMKMNISYDDKTDLLYLRIDLKQQDVINKKIDLLHT